VTTFAVRAPAKINLCLRVLGTRADGYHNLWTILQSLELHDSLTCRAVKGPFRIDSADPECPTGPDNLVWRAAELLWRAGGRPGRPRDTVVHILKRVPTRAGLGGGSSDGVAALRGLSALWRITISRDREQGLAATLGADAPFFLDGGTTVAVERGDLVFSLVDRPAQWVTLVIPPFGVDTSAAYRWWDDAAQAHDQTATNPRAPDCVWPVSPDDGYGKGLGNDLEPVVFARHPELVAIVRALTERGASRAAMSGSGSAVFGLFGSRVRAEAAARALGRGRHLTIVTRTVRRSRYQAMTRPRRREL
jgi:4-diphosphocytidyl-2-C-methyl-D-erythritol kinase